MAYMQVNLGWHADWCVTHSLVRPHAMQRKSTPIENMRASAAPSELVERLHAQEAPEPLGAVTRPPWRERCLPRVQQTRPTL
jgi:hypothetical protein